MLAIASSTARLTCRSLSQAMVHAFGFVLGDLCQVGQGVLYFQSGVLAANDHVHVHLQLIDQGQAHKHYACLLLVDQGHQPPERLDPCL